MIARRFGWLIALVGLLGAAQAAPDTEASVSWRRRPLREPAPNGYLAVATLSRAKDGPATADLVCPGEAVELKAEPGHYAVLVGGREVARCPLEGQPPETLFAKRTPAALLLGLNGRWVYSCAVGPSQGPPEVRLGVSPALEVKSFRVVAREQVRFADDFPDPEPKPGVWEPVRGQWALSSLSFADHSVNPAELAAVFDKIDDVASRGRTREHYVGVGIQLGQEGRAIQVVRMAGDSPAERAGLQQGDVIRKINGAYVTSVADATALLDGNVGQTVTLTCERNGKAHTVELTRELVVWGKTRRQVPILPACEDRVALMVGGYDFWTDYRFAAAARTEGVGAFGLVFAYLGPRDYHVFRWLGAEKVDRGPGRWLLERVRGVHREVLASREGGFFPNDFYALSVEIAGDELGRVKATCSVDGMTVLSAADDALVPGKIGFWAEAPGVVFFDDLVVGERAGKGAAAARGTKNYYQLNDPTMKNWANPAYQWDYEAERYWNKAPFPGDVALTAPLAAEQTEVLTVSAAEHTAASGYSLELPGGGKRGTLRRAGKTVLEKPLSPKAAKRVTLAREGSRIRVALDGQPWLDFQDPQPLKGGLVAVVGVLLSDVQVESPNVVEDYFNGCPTEWHVLRGSWEVMNRWVCDPRWSFFGGRNDEGLLAIWSKRRLEGDCAADVDAGVMMMERSGRYENMRDIGVSICAQNQDLASGYTVIVGANDNRESVLYRRGQRVAATSDPKALLPNRYVGGFRGRTAELYTQHRGWEHIRLAREGRTVRFYLWDRLCLSYDDPDPLPDGHAAIWNLENGLLVAKVRLAATRLGPPLPVLRTAVPFDDYVVTNDCLDGDARIDRAPGAGDGSDAYKITNTIGGGPFPVAFRPRVFSALDRPTLSFEIKLSPEAKVDFYFTCRGTLYRVPLSAPPDTTLQAEVLPAPEGLQADGNWHRVIIDLLGILRKRHPGDDLLVVWEPMIANFSSRDYLLAGLSGNGAGATYWLRDVALARSARLAHAAPAPADRR